MRYIIMCGGAYKNWSQPKHLAKVKGEPLVARTIRLLREYGIEDIAISSNDPVFEQFGVPVLHHDNPYIEGELSLWTDCFYPMTEPCCYVFGDVVFSPNAIRTIITTETKSIEFFASAKPFGWGYPKRWVEPFAFKVVDHELLRRSIEEVRHLHEVHHAFRRSPLSWELWEVITKQPLNVTPHNYTVINDYTCDIDEPGDINHYKNLLE